MKIVAVSLILGIIAVCYYGLITYARRMETIQLNEWAIAFIVSWIIDTFCIQLIRSAIKVKLYNWSVENKKESCTKLL